MNRLRRHGVPASAGQTPDRLKAGLRARRVHGVSIFARSQRRQAVCAQAGGACAPFRGAVIAERAVGAGRLVLFGPEIAFRAQPHGTFKFLFNGIVNAGLAQPRVEVATEGKEAGPAAATLD